MLLYKMKNMMYSSTYKGKPAPAPKIKVTFKVEIQVYKSHSQPLAVKLDLEYVKKLAKFTMITPLLTASTADTGP